MELGADDYRAGALQRLADSRVLRDAQHWIGAVYSAGRAVEGMCRALLWLKTREQEIGHDLRDLLKRVGYFGMVEGTGDLLLAKCNEVACGLWFNNLRFGGQDAYVRHLKAIKRDRGVKGDPLRYNASRFVEACESIVARGDLVWNRSRTG
jgi:hypothetical protein